MGTFSFEVFNNLSCKSIAEAEKYRDSCNNSEKEAVVEPSKKDSDTITSKTEEKPLEAKIGENSPNIAELREEYKEKYGKYPSAQMKEENLRKKLA